MPNDQMKSSLVLTSLALLIGVGIGYAAGTYRASPLGLTSADLTAAENAVRQETRQQFEEALAQRGLAATDRPVHDLYGVITEVGEGSFTLEYRLDQFSVIETGTMTTTVRLAAGAKIYRLVPSQTASPEGGDLAPGGVFAGDPQDAVGLTDEEMHREMEEADAFLAPAFEREPVPFSQVNAGMYVHVISAGDVREATVEASEVVIQRENGSLEGDLESMPAGRSGGGAPEGIEPPPDEGASNGASGGGGGSVGGPFAEPPTQ